MDKMNTSWETIFHLSEAMSLLLSEALHADNHNYPKGLINSLCDLLVIINSLVVKSRQKVDTNLPVSSSVNEESHFEMTKNSDSIKVDDSRCNQNELSKDFLEFVSLGSNSEKNSNSSLYKNKFCPHFLSISEKMVSGTFNKGYYCHFCKEEFLDDEKWKAHFNLSQIHQDTVKIAYDKFGSCRICKFRIFAESAEVNSLIAYHEGCHKDYDLNMENYSDCSEDSTSGTNEGDYSEIDDTASEYSRLCDSPDNTDEKEPRRYKTGFKKQREYKNNTIKNEFVKTLNFEKFCSAISENHFPNTYYCRPCDKCYTDKNQWENHCAEEKHQRFMSSKKFKNYKGICSYCNLEIIGTKITVQQYMNFHNESHNKVSSYTCDEINISQNIRKRGLPTSGKLSNKGQKYKSVFNNQPRTSGPKLVGSDDSQNEDRERNKIKLKVIGLYHNQSRDRSKHKWYCLPCDVVAYHSSMWIDHLSSIEHRDRQTKEDEKVEYSKLNLCFFGNKDFIADALENVKRS